MGSQFKKVLVPLGIEPGKVKFEERHFFRRSYPDKLVQRNILPVFVSSVLTKEMIDELISEADGGLFMGGVDVDPTCYGEPMHPKTRSTPDRDSLELKILNSLLTARKPFLGICRGAQVLTVGTGGTLHQHIPDMMLTEIHEPSKSTYAGLQSDPPHEVLVSKSSRAYAILKSERIRVNSSHHQAAKTVGPDIVVSGKSPEGIAEIIEHRDKDYFCFGLQSHPEVFETSDLEEFFSAFANAL